jgi:hypothetical protein
MRSEPIDTTGLGVEKSGRRIRDPVITMALAVFPLSAARFVDEG